MRHRGPDDAGLWWSPDFRVGLAHRRLSIIDLSAAGHQPMAGEDGLQIVFNGEIYNYREIREELRRDGLQFRTGTDTEVILQAYRAWGVASVERLNGMFAFAIWDPRKRQLFMARDRAGEKPLFYAAFPGRFAFASELKALMADPDFPRSISPEGLEHYLAYGYVGHDRSILQGVAKLPQGHVLTYDMDAEQVHVRRYWSLPAPRTSEASAEDDLVTALEHILEDAVRRQLVAADVPVGVLLSGGVDSSLVTALAARASSSPLQTYTISFPGASEYDESHYARLVASHFGTDHTELVAEPASVELLPQLARQYDEPIGDSSMVPTFLVSRLIRQHATVALGGDGGDELFGGYAWYSRFLRNQRASRFVPRLVRRAAGAAIGSAVPAGSPGKGMLTTYVADLPESMAQQGIFFERSLRERLLCDPALKPRRASPPEGWRRNLASADGTPVQRMTATDFASYLVDDILVKVDRASMLNSLEVRAPWLDYRVIEFAFREVPDRLKATPTEKKILPRRLARRLLPPALDLNRKRGFSIPLDRWITGPWGAFFADVLTQADPAFLDRALVQRMLAWQRGGLAHAHRLFALTMLELWRREYRIALC